MRQCNLTRAGGVRSGRKDTYDPQAGAMAKNEPDADFIAFVTDRMLWLRRVAFALCQDWHEADDLAQTSIAKFYTRRPRIHSTDNLDGYLRTIVSRTCPPRRETKASVEGVCRQRLSKASVEGKMVQLRLLCRSASAPFDLGWRGSRSGPDQGDQKWRSTC